MEYKQAVVLCSIAQKELVTLQVRKSRLDPVLNQAELIVIETNIARLEKEIEFYRQLKRELSN